MPLDREEERGMANLEAASRRVPPERPSLPSALARLVKEAIGAHPPTTRGVRAYNQILESAREAFALTDYQEISVDRIAGQAGMSVGSVYRYFGSKEGLFLVVLADCLGELYEAARSVWSMPWGYLERLQASAGEYLTAYARNRYILGSATQLGMSSGRVREMSWAMRDTIHRAMANRLAEDQRIAGVQPLETETLMRALIAMVDGYAHRAYVDLEFGSAESAPSRIEHTAEVLGQVWYRSIFGTRDAPRGRGPTGTPAPTG
jgi:AcrR family transcriptional regulator